MPELILIIDNGFLDTSHVEVKELCVLSFGISLIRTPHLHDN